MAASGKKDRDSAVDITKGFCVVAMLLHHGCNYFPLDWPVIRLVRFVSGAFVFLSGNLLMRHYAKAYNLESMAVYARILGRAARLMAVYLMLNLMPLAFNVSIGPKQGLSSLGAGEMLSTLLWKGDYHLLHFDLLPPIAYTLAAGALTLYICRRNTLRLKWLALFAIIPTVFTEFPGRYFTVYTTIGLVGLALGAAWQPSREFLLKKRWHISAIWGLILAGSWWLRQTFPVYFALVIAHVGFYYTWGVGADPKKLVYKWLIVLGKHSLFAYLFQIGCFQLAGRLMAGTMADLDAWCVGTIAVSILTSTAVVCVDYLKAKSKLFAGVYGAAFQ